MEENMKNFEVVDGVELDDDSDGVIVEPDVIDGVELVQDIDKNEEDKEEYMVVDGLSVPNHEVDAQELRNTIKPLLLEEEKEAKFKELCTQLIQVETTAWQCKLMIINKMRQMYDDKVLTNKLVKEGVVDKLREAQKLVRMSLLKESNALPEFDSYSKSQIETISSLEPEIVKDNLSKLTPDLSFKQMRENVTSLNPKSKKTKSTESNDVDIDLNSLNGKHVWISVNNLENIKKYSELMSKSKISDCVAIKRSSKYCQSNTLLIDTHEGLSDEIWNNIVTHEGTQYEYTFSGILYTETSYSMGMIFIPKAFFKYLHIEDLEEARG